MILLLHVVKVVIIVGTVYTGARRIDAGAQISCRQDSDHWEWLSTSIVLAAYRDYKKCEFTVKQNADITR